MMTNSPPPTVPDETLISYEQAESILEEERLECLKQMDVKNPTEAVRRRQFYFHFISHRLVQQGETRPVSIAHVDTRVELPQSRVGKTLDEWQELFLEAALSEAGISL